MSNLLKINKLDVAVYQLDKAIELLLDGEAIASVTLAGASEEILGKLLDSEKNAYEILREELSAKYDHCIKLAGESLNITRNWLKHHGDNHQYEIEIDPEQEAVQVIARALTNLLKYDNTLPSQYPAFEEWLNTQRSDLLPGT